MIPPKKAHAIATLVDENVHVLPEKVKDLEQSSPETSPETSVTLLDNPYEWSLSRKISIALIVSLAQLITLMTASMIAPTLPQIQRDLRMSSTEGQLAFSIFQLALGLGPLVLAPASELLGRKPVWTAANLFYIFWNAMCPVGKTKGMMIAGRFLAGIGASCGPALSSPILADMFKKEHRGKSLALATLFPYLGPALGPIVGGIVSQHINWPWLFYILSIFSAVVVILGVIIIRETYAPVLQRLQQAQNQGRRRRRLTPPNSADIRRFLSKSKAALAVPIEMSIRRPIIQIMSFLAALEFGIYVLVLSIYATLFLSEYHETKTQASLHYIAIALGAWIAAQGGGRLMDIIFKHLKARAPDQEAPPEHRIPILALGVFIVPVGLFWLGWSAQVNLHWIMIDIGAAVFVCGCFLVGQAVIAYLLDEFPTEAASANAAAKLSSYMLGFVFPLFAPQLYTALGYGWGTSLLALIWIVLAVPMTVVLWVKGEMLRGIGKR